MKIIIASTIVPFINGGGTFIVDWLEEKLNEYGHQAQSIRIPHSSNFEDMLSQNVGLRMYHLEDECDRLITIRMPAYLLKHPEKYLWFIHHYREVYDLWDSQYEVLPRTERTLAVRECIKRADDTALAEAKKIYTNSQVVSDRLLKYNGIEARPVYPPVLHPEQFHCEKYGDYIYYSSRICSHKRQLLAIQAMKYTRTDVKLLITGKIENETARKDIREEIDRNHLEQKVTVVDDWISEEQKAVYLSECLAAAYIPFDEDSYGYPSLEAHHSQKAVISCTDSGGTWELIRDGYNGFMVEPDPKKLAAVFDRLFEDRELAEKMGKNGLKRIDELEITWDNVIRRFTE